MTEVALGASPPCPFVSAAPISLLVGLCILLVLGCSFLRLLDWPKPTNSASIVEAETAAENLRALDRVPRALLQARHPASSSPTRGWAVRKMRVNYASPVSRSAGRRWPWRSRLWLTVLALPFPSPAPARQLLPDRMRCSSSAFS